LYIALGRITQLFHFQFLLPGSIVFLCSKIATANQRIKNANVLTNKSTVKKCDCWICITVNAENNDASNPTRGPYRRETRKYRKTIANKSASAETWRPNSLKFAGWSASTATRVIVMGRLP
jgi:hypothetical protein